ncbi:DinB family protein [Brucepastera parasyntrophica]|uniref:DinB family protein n=1 Tax=Brucepastera parasyntrophica TaxID=2880008 RepID=UPI003F6F4CF1
MNAIIETLSDEEWNKEFPAYYKSIHEMCSHILSQDHKWLRKFRTLDKSKSLNDSRLNPEYPPLTFRSINDYLSERKIYDEMIINFVNELSENDFNIKMSEKFDGMEFNYTPATGLMHVSQHQTHHRGMISLYLEFIGKENNYSNFI